MEWKWSSQSSRLPPLLSCLAQPMVYPYPWQPEGRASYEIKATGGRETGHIYFDVFTSHERRWQPPNVSTHDALGQLPASVHFTSPSLSRICDISKSIKSPKTRIHPPHPCTLRFFFDVRLCCFLFIWNMKVASVFKNMFMTIDHWMPWNSSSRPYQGVVRWLSW